MENKGKKTSAVAYGAIILVVALFVAMFLGIITADDVFKGITAITGFGLVLTGWLSKDSDATHSKSTKGSSNTSARRRSDTSVIEPDGSDGHIGDRPDDR